MDLTKNRLDAGERLTWTSSDGVHTVIVQRTDAGQTWTVTRLHCGHLQHDPDGTPQIWTHNREAGAMDQARFMAETLRGLNQVVTL